ncbi:glycosyltransferase [Ornithinimicrobium cavernae]|uniref:glycosyltransferase n=1 Tax=Ornithinimicrobium cavernae TaxID=2666047 RepID=UPI000D69CD3A|nr:glycosyltransferase [Ornithinimicrobium cavernae]
MALKQFMRRLPPIAWRDARLRELKAQNKRLRESRATVTPRRRPTGWLPPEPPALADLVRESGLFDEAWYLSQVTDTVADALEHFLLEGQQAGLSPHPGFLAPHYLAGLPRGDQKKAAVLAAPFTHYLTVGAAAGRSPHPLFDAGAYLEAYPRSARVAGGPLADFLARGRALTPASGASGVPWDEPRGFLEAARAAAEILRETRGYTHIERDTPDFDLEREAAVKADLRSQPLPDDPPLVSVVIPTKDRADLLGATLDSVLAQTYPHWQLVVVDDGSRDGTPALLERYARDERIEVVRHEEARGVAAARNAGLARARGTYVAYLDSDNTWFPDFLELMVRHLVRSGDRAAYGVTALVEEGGQGRHLYRGLPFDREHLRERNYIDCIVLVHERSLLEATGGFDETLKRNVDWDLFIRLADETDFTHVPVLATQYDVWSEQGERITTLEPMAYRFVVRQRTLVDLAALRETAADRDPGLVSAVVAVGPTDSAESVVTAVRQLLETATGGLEVAVLDARTSEAEFVRLHAELGLLDGVSVRRLSQSLPLELVRNVGVAETRGGILTFLPATVWAQPGWDQPLRDGLERHSVVQPLVLTSGGAVWSAGLDFLDNGSWYLPWSGFSGDAPELDGERTVVAASAAALAVRAEDFLAVDGFDPLLRDDVYGGDLSLRVTDHTGGTAGCATGSTVAWRVDPAEVRSASALGRARDNQRRDRERWRQVGSPTLAPEAVLPHYRLLGFDRARNTQVAPQPLLVHDRPERPLRWAIKIGPPTVERRTNWGDWHFARSLKASLERLGHEVSIDCKGEWYRPSSVLDDVVLQMRGVSVYEVNPGHTNVSWVISHPDRVTAGELSDYDLVFGASPRWCGAMTQRLGRPVLPMLQCTDHHRFHPVEPDRRRAHQVLAVANARGLRPSVAAALDSGIVPAVYGLRWEGLLPEGAWQAPYIPNEELPGVYCAAGVVLNDHWDDMRDLGILSNRLFDLAACDARVISDYLPEVEEVFGDVVLTFGEGTDLAELVAAQLTESPERAEARRALGARIRTEHTFDARAAQLSEAVTELRARTGSPLRGSAK